MGKLIGYKVVIYKDDRYYSYCSCTPVEYFIGSTTVPEEGGGPLLLFKEKSDAIDFSNRNAHLTSYEVKVFKGEYKISSKTFIWNKGFHNRCINVGANFPVGTVLADEITLLEEIKL